MSTSRSSARKDRTKPLLAVLAVLIVIVLYTRSQDETVTPPAVPAPTEQAAPAPGGAAPAPSAGTDQPVTPRYEPVPTKFPGTKPVTVPYNPFRSPIGGPPSP